jgi:fatty acid-binding protein DegV
MYAVECARAGDNAAEILRKLDYKALKVAAYFAVPDLAPLGKTGRLPKPVVALGSMLNVSLVLRMNEQGAITLAGQSRSYDKTCELMIDAVLRTIEHSSGAWVAISHGNDPDVARQLASQFEEKLGHPPRKQFMANTPLTILSNLGSKGVGIFAIVP